MPSHVLCPVFFKLPIIVNLFPSDLSVCSMILSTSFGSSSLPSESVLSECAEKKIELFDELFCNLHRVYVDKVIAANNPIPNQNP